jgi:hypothetical protein
MSNSPAMASREGATMDDANGSRKDKRPRQAVVLSRVEFDQLLGSIIVVSPLSISTLLGVFSPSTLMLLPLPLSLSCDFLPSDIFLLLLFTDYLSRKSARKKTRLCMAT